MTAGSLAGLTVVVTRPAAQAGPFIAMAGWIWFVSGEQLMHAYQILFMR